jgi:hypothetical protein
MKKVPSPPSNAKGSMGIYFFSTTPPPLTLENAMPKPHPGGNPLHSDTPSPSTMETLGGVFASPRNDRQKTHFAPSADKPRPSNGRIPLGRGMPPGRFRSSVPSTLKSVLTRLGVNETSDPEAVHRAVELHQGILTFSAQIRADSNFLKASAKNDAACTALLSACLESPAKIFTLIEADYPPMRWVFRVLAQKYHSDSRFPGSTPDPAVFTIVTTAWSQIKELYGWG